MVWRRIGATGSCRVGPSQLPAPRNFGNTASTSPTRTEHRIITALHPALLTLDIEDFREEFSAKSIRDGVDCFRAHRVVGVEEQPDGITAHVKPASLGGDEQVVNVSVSQDGRLRVEVHVATEGLPHSDQEALGIAAILAYQMQRPITDEKLFNAEGRARLQRRERAFSEVVVTLPASGPGYGEWRAQSAGVKRPGRGAYHVSLRSLSRRVNGCTCPDFRRNRLGTCKHIEAVRASAARRRWTPPAGAMITAEVDATGTWRLGVLTQGSAWQLTSDASNARPLSVEGWEALPRVTPDGLRDDDAARLERAGRREARESRYLALGTVEQAKAIVADLLEHQDVFAGEDVMHLLNAHARRVDVRARQRRWQRRLEGSDWMPPGLRATPFPYQRDGIRFLLENGRAMLADDMGLGKTLQAIAATQWMMHEGEIERAMVVCPTSLLEQWRDELEHFTGLRVCVMEGPASQRRAMLSTDADVFVTTYDRLRRDFGSIRRHANIDLLIIDEAQRIKNWATRNARHVAALHTDYLFVLTGTPLENRLEELHALIELVDPAALGPAWQFFETHTLRGSGGESLGFRQLDRVRERLSSTLLRRQRSTVLHDLPSRMDTDLIVPLGDAQRGLHDDHVDQAKRLAAILRRRPLAPIERQRLLAHLSQARMACDSAALLDPNAEWRSPKLEALAELLESIAEEPDTKVIVFSEWVRMGAFAGRVAAECGLGWVQLHGGVPSKKRGALIKKFRDDESIRVFVSSDSGGVGLNLQRASVVIHLDCPWNPAVMEQRTARVHRQGQKVPVRVYRILAGGIAYEMHVAALVRTKQALFNAVLSDETTDSLQVGEKQFDAIARQLDAGSPPPTAPVDVNQVAAKPEDNAERARVAARRDDEPDGDVDTRWGDEPVGEDVSVSEPRSAHAQAASGEQRPDEPGGPFSNSSPTSEPSTSASSLSRPLPGRMLREHRAAELLWVRGHHDVALTLMVTARIDALANQAEIRSPAYDSRMAWLLGPDVARLGLPADELLAVLRASAADAAGESSKEVLVELGGALGLGG